jgi:hypothetical protein
LPAICGIPKKETSIASKRTITRCINDYSSDAEDFNKTPDHDLFQRVKPATYRLRSFPDKPNVYELAPVRFIERAMRRMWADFGKMMKDKFPEKWSAATNHERHAWFCEMDGGSKRAESL